jgi:hypothetical protein
MNWIPTLVGMTKGGIGAGSMGMRREGNPDKI